MAWNEPGGGDKKDPWSSGGGNKNSGGPPDLDQIWRRFRDRLRGGSGRGSGGSSGSPSGGGAGGAIIIAVVVVAVLIWLATGLYVVQPGEKGVVLRFGAYSHTAKPGWHWRFPYPVEQVYKVDTQKVRRATNRAVMLTDGENYVDVEVSAQYRISNAMRYLFKLRNPNDTVKQVLRASVREIVGTSSMNQVIQEGLSVKNLKEKVEKKVDLKQEHKKKQNKNHALKDLNDQTVKKIKQREHEQPTINQRSRASLPKNVRKLMQYKLSQYQAGIQLVAVNVQYAQPPEQVQEAFEEAIKAREEKVNKKNKARAYARAVVARAQGEKAQKIAQARAYRERKVQRAEGEATRFTNIEKQYEKAPKVTRKRLYLQTMGEVLGKTHLIVRSGDNGSMSYLPLQKLIDSKPVSKQGQSNGSGSSSNSDTGGLPEVPMKNAQNNGGNAGSSGSANPLRSRNRSR